MKKLLVASIVMMTCTSKAAQNVNVDIVSTSSKESKIIMTVDGCDTFIKIKTEELPLFLNSKKLLQEASEEAIAHSKSGCK